MVCRAELPRVSHTAGPVRSAGVVAELLLRVQGVALPAGRCPVEGCRGGLAVAIARAFARPRLEGRPRGLRLRSSELDLDLELRPRSPMELAFEGGPFPLLVRCGDTRFELRGWLALELFGDPRTLRSMRATLGGPRHGHAARAWAAVESLGPCLCACLAGRDGLLMRSPFVASGDSARMRSEENDHAPCAHLRPDHRLR